MIPMPIVPLPPFGFRVDIVSLPEAWLRLSDKAQWDKATQKLLSRIGMVCQTHIRNIMQGIEPRRDGQTIRFQEATGRGIQSIQWELHGNSVDIYGDESTKTKGGASYLVYQEHGVSTQPMKWLVGKTIPWVLVNGVRTNPKTGTVVQGVTRVKFAGPGSRYASVPVNGAISQTKKVGKEAVDGRVHYTTITEATFSQPSKYNPTGYRWWHPGYEGKRFFRDGVWFGVRDAADAIKGLVFRVAGGSPEPELGTDLTGPDTHFTQEYQDMLDALEKEMEQSGTFPFTN